MSKIGRYEIESEIGRGNMGVVYLAWDPHLRRKVAVKILVPPQGLSLTEQRRFATRFIREAQAAAVLSHPAIVTIYDVGQDPDAGPFIAMEYVVGRTLRDILRDEGHLDPMRALEFLEPLAEALHVAHGAGIVHRDVKPANILMGPSDSTVKLTDFGLAKLDRSDLTNTGMTLGSPGYMSPEQVRSLPLNGRSDLFSLALIAYECLCGCRPFRGAEPVAMAHSLVYDELPPISEQMNDCPKTLDLFFGRALAKNPADRFRDGKSFREGLRVALGANAAPEKLLSVPEEAPPTVSDEPQSMSPGSFQLLAVRLGAVARSLLTPPSRIGLAAGIVIVSVLAVWALVGGESPPQLDSTSVPGAPPIAAVEAARAPEPVTPPAPAPEKLTVQWHAPTVPDVVIPLVADAEPQAPDPSPAPVGQPAEPKPRAADPIVPAVTNAPAAEESAERPAEPPTDQPPEPELPSGDGAAYEEVPAESVGEPVTEDLSPPAAAVETMRPAPEAVDLPDVGAPPIVELAFLDVRIKTTVASGWLTAWVDDKQVYSLRLTAPEGEKGIRKLQFWKRGESITAWIEIPAGGHELCVELIEDGGSGNRSQQSRTLELQPGEVRKLKIVAGKEGTPLSLRAD